MEEEQVIEVENRRSQRVPVVMHLQVSSVFKQNNVNVSNLFEKKGIIEEDESTIDNDLTKKLIINALDIALDNLIAMRAVEGSKIENNLLEKLDILTNVVAKIQEYAPVQVKNYRDKLRGSVQEAIGDM